MRGLGLGLATVAVTFGFVAGGCGDTDNDEPNGAAGSAGQSVGGAAGSASAGKSGSASGGSASGGSRAGATAGGASAAGSSGSGGASAAGTPGEAGGPGEASGGASLVDCDARKVTCKIAIPQCPDFQVPAVAGSCWGDCVKIAECACSEAAECPDSNQYTCWSQQHCGPYVR